MGQIELNYQVLPLKDWTLEPWQWKGTLHSPKLQHYWNLTIRLFSVISRTFVVVGFLPIFREAVGVFYSHSRLGKLLLRARVDLGVMAMKRYFAFSKAPALPGPAEAVGEFYRPSWKFEGINDYFLYFIT